ncbi:MAG: alpha/beta hydrolase [Bacteroidales bacterium]|nr:MAG: alpha/beta hydrolase [Bacteroidales bacterium]
MKKNIVFALFLIVSKIALGQNIVGQWSGSLEIQGNKLPIVFNIEKSDDGYRATMDSPSQGAKGIPVEKVSLDNNKLEIKMPKLQIEYQGACFGDELIIGTFKQAGLSLPLNLTKSKTAIVINRPQEPKEPFSYHSEEVNFINSKENLVLAGTLSLPKKDGYFPAVILISGSGPQNRNEEVFGHKPFLVLADYLTRNGIAVLRFDDRGVGKSTGDFSKATTANFATDVEAALDYLLSRKEINSKKIGLIGHSEGGIIAPMVAVNSKNVSFIVLMAGTGINGAELLLMQQELIGKASGASDVDLQKTKLINQQVFDRVLKISDNDKLKVELTDYLKKVISENPEMNDGKTSESEIIEKQFKQILNPWMLYFLRHNPADVLEKVSCPVLAINGEKDLQVPADVNLNAIKNALDKAQNKIVTIKKFPNLNHLFQESTTGSPSEYGTIEQTISPVVLVEIGNWIKNWIEK